MGMGSFGGIYWDMPGHAPPPPVDYSKLFTNGKLAMQHYCSILVLNMTTDQAATYI